MPRHVLGGMPCGGSNHPPLHIDTKHAEQEVANLKNELHEGLSSKISIIKKINGHKNRIEFFKTFKAEGEWTLFATWKIADAYYCEEMVHSKLEKFKYDLAPFGEVFKYPSENTRQLVTEVIAADFKKYACLKGSTGDTPMLSSMQPPLTVPPRNK
jgi:hypothetical protein